MDKLIKNIEHKTVLKIKDEVTYQKGQIVSKTLSQNEHHSLTLFAFDKGEEISTHESGGDAMIVALDGVGKITIEGRRIYFKRGRNNRYACQKASRCFCKGTIQNASYRYVP